MNRFSKITISLLTTSVLLSTFAASISQAQAQTMPSNSSNILEMYNEVLALNRAKNLARMAAERENGGLNYYRAEPSMHGPAEEAPYVDNGDGTWTFTFNGSVPGSTTPVYRSVVTVSRNGEMVRVDSNERL